QPIARGPSASDESSEQESQPSHIGKAAHETGVRELFEVVVVDEACHFRFGAFQQSVGTLEGSGTGAERGMINGSSGCRVPIIESRAYAGGAHGEVALKPD